MAYDLVIRGGRVFSGGNDYVADVAISGETIAAIGRDLRGEREIDAGGLYVLPGAIDGHVHMRTERDEWVYDDTFATGSIAAAYGGVTTIIDQVQVEPGTGLVDGLERRLDEAHGQSVIDYAFHLNPREAVRSRLDEFPRIVEMGVPTFKFFMAYDGFRVPDWFVFDGMQRLGAAGGLALIHAENHEIIDELLRQNAAAGRTARQHNASARPPQMEGEAVHRALAMASVAGARTLIFHLTAAEAVREVALAKSRGQAAFGEACLTYLLLGPEALDDPVSGTALDFSPPLRSAEHRDALWSGLADGTIDIISTDHGPRRRVADDEGNWTTPPGTSGIEVRLALTHTYGVLEDRLTLHQWIARCCTRPAEIFGLDRKGSLQPGRDADVVIFDPNAELPLSAASLHSNIDHSTYEGHIARGLPITTIVRGTEVIRDRSLVAAAGHGRFVPR